MADLDEKGLETGARQEASWDGRDFDALEKADRSRYLGRFAAGVRAYLDAIQAQSVWEYRDDDLSDAVFASHPVKSKRFKTYERAMELVGNRHSKGALVALVNHLLIQAEDATQAKAPDVVEVLREALSKVAHVPGDHPIVPIKYDAFVKTVQRIVDAASSLSPAKGSEGGAK